MTIDRLINTFAVVTLAELMLTIGLGASLAEVWAVARDWRGILRAFAANYVAVPATAVALVLLFRAQPMVAAGVMVVAVCPGAPYGPPFTAMAKGRVGRAVGLMVILAGSSALFAPLLLRFLLPVVAPESRVNVDAARIVGTLVLVQFLPLCIGLGLVAQRPGWAQRLKTPLGRLGTLLNVSLLGLILVVQFHMLAEIRAAGYVGMVVLLACSAAGGWLLGRRDAGDRRTLAITTAVRNVGVGLVIAGGSFPGTPAVTFATAYALLQTGMTALAVAAISRMHLAPAAPARSEAYAAVPTPHGDPRSAPSA
jgi:bile acid:Na+ symporter, BASS family